MTDVRPARIARRPRGERGFRLPPILTFGTQGYPERDRRRLRAVNVTAWLGGASILGFALAEPTTDPWKVAAGLGMMAAPLLHRFGPVWAVLAVSAILYAHMARVISSYGTGDELFVFVVVAALAIPLLGVERLWLAGLVSASGIGIAMYLALTVPEATGAVSEESMRLNSIFSIPINAAILFAVVAFTARQTARAEARAQAAYDRSEALLRAMLPGAIAQRLKAEPGTVIAERHDAATVVFADVVGFTRLAVDTDPRVLVLWLDSLFATFDRLVDAHGMTKIKTSGDGFLAVAGVPQPAADHALTAARFALAMRDAADPMTRPDGAPLGLRLGLASGPVVAGVVGRSRFVYDIWGDTVNVAARLESTGEGGRVQIDAATRALIGPGFATAPRGTVDLKGKGPTETWWLYGETGA